MERRDKILLTLIMLILFGISGWVIYTHNENIKSSIIEPTGKNTQVSNEVIK